MQLDKIQIPLQARSQWSAVDLGFRLAHRWWLSMFLVWLIPSAIPYLILLIIFPEKPWIAILAIWWAKPLWEQLILHMGSRRIFSEQTSTAKTLVQCFSIIKKDWLWWLSIRRLSPNRSFYLPVTTLEKLNGGTRSKRLNVLSRNTTSAPFWLTMLGIILENILLYSILILLYIFLPETENIDWRFLYSTDHVGWENYMINTISLFVMAAFAPYYTMAGFVLYLNRRVELEGWDIELRFRQIAERQKAKTNKSTVAAILLTCLIATSLPSNPSYAAADSITTNTYSAESAKEAINKVLATEDFHKLVTAKQWQRKDLENPDKNIEKIPDWLISTIEALERIGKFIASISGVLEVLLWLGAGALIALLIYRFRHIATNLVDRLKQTEPEIEKPTILFSLDVRKESLPADIPNQARQLWRSNDKRGAISLLYRGSLSKLIHDHNCRFESSDTELECVRKVDRLGQTTLSIFIAHLTDFWQRLAYGHIELTDNEFERICNDWQQALS